MNVDEQVYFGQAFEQAIVGAFGTTLHEEGQECRTVGPKDSAASDVQMRGEIVKMLGLVRFVGHRSAQLLAINPTQ
jgi:hypothetical protein